MRIVVSRSETTSRRSRLTRGSGLIGLHDRIEALGGRVQFSSVAVSGTFLVVTIPFKVE
jgi:signal transduction histidine kinase